MSRAKRMRQVKVFLGIIIISIALGFLSLYQFFGLKQYMRAMSIVKSSSETDKQFAKDNLYSSPEEEFGYSGILARVNGTNSKFTGVWIWGTKGLKYFKGNNSIVFSNYKICETAILENQKVEVNKNFNIGYYNWRKYVRPGDFVGVFLTPNTPGNLQNIQEVYSYDWWVFIKTLPPGNIESGCKNR